MSVIFVIDDLPYYQRGENFGRLDLEGATIPEPNKVFAYWLSIGVEYRVPRHVVSALRGVEGAHGDAVEILNQKKIRRAGCIAGPKKRPYPPTSLKGAGC